MRIPNELLDCVVFLCRETPSGWKYGGTGYFVTMKSVVHDDLSFLYFVTAKHCLDQAGPSLALRLNRKAGGSCILRVEAEWHFSMGGSDVAVLPLELGPNDLLDDCEYKYIFVESAATLPVIQQFDIGPGDELVVTGLFTRHYGQSRNRPIVRMGNIAAMPDEPIKTPAGDVRAYIAEMRSIGGLSGSPVFVRLGPNRPNRPDGVPGQPYYFLLGQIRGHWDAMGNFGQELNQEINMGMALITPVADLLSVLHGDALVAKRKKADEMYAIEKTKTLANT
jgi:hypothetical protein